MNKWKPGSKANIRILNSQPFLPSHYRSSGIEPTPALTLIRRVQKAKEEYKSKNSSIRERAIQQAIAKIEGRPWGETAIPEDVKSNPDLIYAYEEIHLRNQLYWAQRNIEYLESRLTIGAKREVELQGENDDLRVMVKRLRDKLVEQDEVINKLIMQSTSGKKISLC